MKEFFALLLQLFCVSPKSWQKKKVKRKARKESGKIKPNWEKIFVRHKQEKFTI